MTRNTYNVVTYWQRPRNSLDTEFRIQRSYFFFKFLVYVFDGFLHFGQFNSYIHLTYLMWPHILWIKALKQNLSNLLFTNLLMVTLPGSPRFFRVCVSLLCIRSNCILVGNNTKNISKELHCLNVRFEKNCLSLTNSTVNHFYTGTIF